MAGSVIRVRFRSRKKRVAPIARTKSRGRLASRTRGRRGSRSVVRVLRGAVTRRTYPYLHPDGRVEEAPGTFSPAGSQREAKFRANLEHGS